jgi:hypothetical protein
VRRNAIRDRDIGCCWTNGYQRHFEHPDKQAITPATGPGSETGVATPNIQLEQPKNGVLSFEAGQAAVEL